MLLFRFSTSVVYENVYEKKLLGNNWVAMALSSLPGITPWQASYIS